MAYDGTTALHVTYGDDLADAVRTRVPHAVIVVVREALRDGPLTPSPSEDQRAFLAMRAHHLAGSHGADEAAVREELTAAWTRIAEHTGEVVLHVDEQPCIDCAAFAACMLDLLHRSGRGIEAEATGVSIVRGGDLSTGTKLAAADLAAGVGAWRLLIAGDEAGLTLTATDLEGAGGMAGFPELPGLLVRRARGDVPLEDVKP